MKVWNRYKLPKDLVYTYIGRGTQWGNPFVVSEEYTREQSVDAWVKHLAGGLARKEKLFTKMIHDLAGVENIACSCAPLACHGDALAAIWTKIRELDSIPRGIRAWVKENGYPFGPETDGIDHINVYSKGKTSLGRALTNMSDWGFTDPKYGWFRSMEAYWYWNSTGRQHEQLKTLSGFEAKKQGRELAKVPLEGFEDVIRRGLKLRMDQGFPQIKKALCDSTVPLTHYMHYGDDDSVMYTKYDWLVDYLMELRQLYKSTWSKVVIAGSRGFKDYEVLCKAIQDSRFPIHEVVSGKEKSGVDALGELYGRENNCYVSAYPADWDQYGKAAGMIRNAEMAEYADRAIVICVNHSPGSMNMIKEMRKRGKDVYELHIQR